MKLTRALRHRSFAFLWAGQTVSTFGDRLYNIAMVWWLLTKTGSAEAIADVAIFALIPTLILILVGGVVVDRIPRVRVMILSDLVRAVLTAAIAALIFTDALDVRYLYGFAVAFGFVDAFFQPAYSALVPELVPADDRTSANSLRSLTFQLSGIAGPGLGAIIVMLGGIGVAFALDALSFVISAGCLLAVRGGAVQARGPRPASGVRAVVRELVDGVAYMRSDAWFSIGIGVGALLAGINESLLVIGLPILVTRGLGLEIGSLSLVQTAAAIGAVGAAIWIGRHPRMRRRGYYAYATLAIMGACLAGMGIVGSLIGLIPLTMLRLGALSVSNLAWAESVQTLVPADKMGRLSSIEGFAATAALPLAYFVVGRVSDRVAPGPLFVGGGALIVVTALLALVHPRIRKFD